MARFSIDAHNLGNGYESGENRESSKSRLGRDGGDGGIDLQPASLQSSLRDFKETQLKTADTEIWAASGFDTALCTVQQIQRSLRNAMQTYHSNRQAEAIVFFGRCVEGLERFLEMVTSVKCALKIDFAKVETEGRKLNSVERDLLSLLATLIDLQEKTDFDTFADTVEDELLTNLSSWTNALKSLSISACSNA